MILDLLVIGVLSFAALLGAFSGALAQGARLLAAAGAGILSKPAGHLLAGTLGEIGDLPRTLTGPLATSIAFVCIYLVLHLAGRALARSFTRDRELRAVDRSAGAFFGALQAAILVWVVLSVLVGIESKIGLRLGGEGSLSATLVREHDFFSALRTVENGAAAPQPALRALEDGVAAPPPAPQPASSASRTR